MNPYHIEGPGIPPMPKFKDRTTKWDIYIDEANFFGNVKGRYPNTYEWFDFFKLGKLVLDDLYEDLDPPHYDIQTVWMFGAMKPNEWGQWARTRDGHMRDLMREDTEGVNVFLGEYKPRNTTCPKCGHVWSDFVEKRTDSNFAVQLMMNGDTDHTDGVLVLGGDEDIIPAVYEAKNNLEKVIIGGVAQLRGVSAALQRLIRYTEISSDILDASSV
ncbi:hypothetical protein QTQ03_29275 [Micromonospora sp. WMMA1363]|uniref:hypothetical protein n=1 Tax=Micromonospora sp. WMMA1363 TaxID=3053985 RepID=UPI00259C98D0|nr:hypothetical protein [Micromonospora sp. WMMA1363]MDM4723474.1 hypothetical protein [Micromonospora sp. WMMA1363]